MSTSLIFLENIFKKYGLRLYDVEEITTHGGSLRVYGCHREAKRRTEASVSSILQEEKKKGMFTLAYYAEFQTKVDRIKNDLLLFLIQFKKDNKKVVAYGAAAKGNTLLNYAGIKPDLLPAVYDAALSKQGKYMPGSHIKIQTPENLVDENPDCILILPWNIKEEIINQFKRDGIEIQCAVSIPALEMILK
jgi:hypothetical protein